MIGMGVGLCKLKLRTPVLDKVNKNQCFKKIAALRSFCFCRWASRKNIFQAKYMITKDVRPLPPPQTKKKLNLGVRVITRGLEYNAGIRVREESGRGKAPHNNLVFNSYKLSFSSSLQSDTPLNMHPPIKNKNKKPPT